MCLGNDAAEQQRREAARQAAAMKKAEAQRQQAISEGRRNIDTAFGQFNDDFFGGFQNSFLDFFTPQLEDQFEKARAQLVAALAGRGTLESSAGLGALADLSEKNDLERTQIANRAVDASNALRGNVERAKSNLFTLNESSADPQGINARAIGEATALAAPQSFTPLADVFSAALQPFIGFAGNRPSTPTRTFQSQFSVLPTSGSQKVVG